MHEQVDKIMSSTCSLSLSEFLAVLVLAHIAWICIQENTVVNKFVSIFSEEYRPIKIKPPLQNYLNTTSDTSGSSNLACILNADNFHSKRSIHALHMILVVITIIAWAPTATSLSTTPIVPIGNTSSVSADTTVGAVAVSVARPVPRAWTGPEDASSSTALEAAAAVTVRFALAPCLT